MNNFVSAEEYFSTLKYNNVTLRQGPSKNYPVKIFYKKKISSCFNSRCI